MTTTGQPVEQPTSTTGRPVEVSDEKVIETGKALEAAKMRVTGTMLRKHIGGGTPSRMIRVWEAHKQGETVQAEAAATTLPIELEDVLKVATDQQAAALRAIVVNMHTVSTRVAERRVAEISQKAAEEREGFKEELQLAEEMLEAADQTSAELRDELAQLRAALTDKTAELATLTERLDHSRAELAEAKESAAQARQEASAASREAEQAARALEVAKQEHAQAQGRSDAALATETEKRIEAERQLSQSRITCDAVTEKMNAQKTKLAGADEKIKGLEERITDLNRLSDEQRSSLHACRQATMRLERQNDELNAELKKLRETASTVPAQPGSEGKSS
ncbi:DNA-binding protein [Pseudomonas sp.]|uniref:DNA-binding protein n=1 Tax=Pseudomonas sp. TaxID=306 RepID=UPI00290B7230|nr:DNA-binding protein [Pseudomonas sp.]MDU4254584.1 DNA-binding protein [Pseudomonas sp.]